MAQIEKLSSQKTFGGFIESYKHESRATHTSMRFSVFVPPQEGPRPVLFWLSGLTCTDENFVTKAHAFQAAAQHGCYLVAPDTSPRGAGVAGEDEDWDLGTGAGFYVNATEGKWSRHYNMYDYVVEELSQIVMQQFAIDQDNQGIFGHSMGGHGALVIGLRNPKRFQSISAFAPICAPSQCPWGEKAFGAYLGDDREKWLNYDASHLMSVSSTQIPILIDQGSSDDFLEEQLKPNVLEGIAQRKSYPLELRRQPGYDHSYFFISTFVGEHIAFHARHWQ